MNIKKYSTSTQHAETIWLDIAACEQGRLCTHKTFLMNSFIILYI